MPHIPVPHRSGVHRLAAIALYRALLTQCRAFPVVEAHQRNELQNIVRNRFKQARYEASPRWLKLKFEAGYEGLDYLDAAVAGEEGSKVYVLTLLEKAPERIKGEPVGVISKRLRRGMRKRERERERNAALPLDSTGEGGVNPTREGEEDEEKNKKPSLFDRPLPLDQLSGRRHVPVLFNAQGIPVLRIKKPQPQRLSSYINNRAQQRQRRHDLRHRIEDELEIAKLEDRWDSIIDAATTMDNRGEPRVERTPWEPEWSRELGMARKEINRILDEERRKNGEMAEKMQAVVDREREIYEEEKKARKREKSRELRRRKRRAVHANKEHDETTSDSNDTAS